MIDPEINAQIRRYFYAEHWKIGTIARELNVHPDTVRHALESQHRGGAQPLRPSIVDPYVEFIRPLARLWINIRDCARPAFTR
ncbi:MAG: hypothetical protein M3Y27_28640 [Acidobacteriota bacterium]|nr:hypothetical protein [Acidobacteriota bacterium]